MEEYVNGTVHTYDAIINSKGEPLFETGNVTMDSIMDIVNTRDNSCYYIEKNLPDAMRDIGRRTVAAFGVKSRFVHLEFFVLNEDQPALGKKAIFWDLRSICVRPADSARICSTSLTRPTFIRFGRIWSLMTAAH